MEEQFIKELKDLLEKYNASISVDCDSSSDTHGITGECLSIQINNKEIKNISGWELSRWEL